MRRSLKKLDPYRNQYYLDWIKLNHDRCHFCEDRPPDDAHHMSLGDDDGIGTKPPDTQAVPCCRICHNTARKKATYEDARAIIRYNADYLGELQAKACHVGAAMVTYEKAPSEEGAGILRGMFIRVLEELAGVPREAKGDVPF